MINFIELSPPQSSAPTLRITSLPHDFLSCGVPSCATLRSRAPCATNGVASNSPRNLETLFALDVTGQPQSLPETVYRSLRHTQATHQETSFQLSDIEEELLLLVQKPIRRQPYTPVYRQIVLAGRVNRGKGWK